MNSMKSAIERFNKTKMEQQQLLNPASEVMVRISIQNLHNIQLYKRRESYRNKDLSHVFFFFFFEYILVMFVYT